MEINMKKMNNPIQKQAEHQIENLQKMFNAPIRDFQRNVNLRGNQRNVKFNCEVDTCTAR